MNDIVLGNNDTTGHVGGYSAGKGWDAASGWGSPSGAALLKSFWGVGFGTPGEGLNHDEEENPEEAQETRQPGGAGGRLFANPAPGADETTFQVDNTSQAYYNSPYYLLHQDQLQPVPTPSVPQPAMSLAEVVGPAVISAVQAAKKIAFHAVGTPAPPT